MEVEQMKFCDTFNNSDSELNLKNGFVYSRRKYVIISSFTWGVGTVADVWVGHGMRYTAYAV